MWRQLWLEGFPFVPFDFHVLFRSFHVFTFWTYIPQTHHKLSSWKIPPKKLLKSNFQFTHHNWKLPTPNNTKNGILIHLSFFEKKQTWKERPINVKTAVIGRVSFRVLRFSCSVPFLSCFSFWNYIPQTHHKLSSWKIPPKKLLKSNFQFTHHNWKLPTPNNTKNGILIHLSFSKKSWKERPINVKTAVIGRVSFRVLRFSCSVPFMFLLFKHIYSTSNTP